MSDFNEALLAVERTHRDEVVALERALWIAVNGDRVLRTCLPEDEKFAAQMNEAKQLAARICEERCAWVAKTAMAATVDRLRQTAGVNDDAAEAAADGR